MSDELLDRLCPVCEQPVRNRRRGYVTCGHPRCIRTNRQQKKNAWRRDNRATEVRPDRTLADWTPPDVMAPDTKGVRAMVAAWDALDGRHQWERMTLVAEQTREPMRVVWATLKAQGRL